MDEQLWLQPPPDSAVIAAFREGFERGCYSQGTEGARGKRGNRGEKRVARGTMQKGNSSCV